METYINSGRDKYIVDPDKDKIYTKRKQRRIALNEPSEEPNTKQAKPTPFQPVYPSSGWSNDLKRIPFFNLFISNSGKKLDIYSVRTK